MTIKIYDIEGFVVTPALATCRSEWETARKIKELLDECDGERALGVAQVATWIEQDGDSAIADEIGTYKRGILLSCIHMVKVANKAGVVSALNNYRNQFFKLAVVRRMSDIEFI